MTVRFSVRLGATNVGQLIGVTLAVLFAFGTTSALAQILVIDQDTDDGTHAIQPHAPVAQSFTATWNEALDTIQPYVRTFNPQFPRNPLEMELFIGSGLGGSSLGVRTADGGDGFNGYLPFDWSGITLVAGQAYTFEVRDQNPYWGWSNVGRDAYAGGERILQGSFLATEDWRFRITVAPEPSSLAFMLTALAGLGIRRPRGIRRIR